MVSQDKEQIEHGLRQGLLNALDNRTILRQQRVHSAIDMDKLEEKVKARLKPEMASVYNILEAISREFERKNLGYRHNAYLVFVAGAAAVFDHGRIPFTLGTG